MADLLVRDVPDEVVAAIDTGASRLGLSRSEYVRRALAREAELQTSRVGVEDLSQFADTFADLADADLMRRAWQ